MTAPRPAPSSKPRYERLDKTVRVKPGSNDDVCPLCGILRPNAGFIRESCGDGFLKPDCFVERAS